VSKASIKLLELRTWERNKKQSTINTLKTLRQREAEVAKEQSTSRHRPRHGFNEKSKFFSLCGQLSLIEDMKRKRQVGSKK
jgi:hypothetical protein